MNRQISLLLKSFVRKVLSFLFLGTIFLFPQFVYCQTEQEIIPLEPEKPIEREISGGQKHIYQIALAENQYAKLIVEQRGVDVVIRLLDADRKIAVEYDFDPRNTGEELVEMTVKQAGNYQLAVEPRQRNASGRYEIRIVEIRNATEKEFAVDETRRLITEANRLWRLGNYDDALPLAERALVIREKELGTESYDFSQAIFVLANIWSDKADYAKSESFYERALEIREKIMGKDHLSVGLILNNMGTLYRNKGDYDNAEKVFRRALEIREKTLERNHLLIASVLNNLGNLSKEKGDIAKADLYYRRTLEIRENALGKESAEVAVTLNNIANLYEDFAKAEPLYLRALAVREKVFGTDHQEVGQTLYNLSILYAKAGNLEKAVDFGERTLKIFENKLGAEHPFTSYPLNLLAALYKDGRDFEKSEVFYLRSIAIKEKTQGSYHPTLGGVLSNLANLYSVKGEIEKAIAAQKRANEISEYNITLNLTLGSESEKINYLKTFSPTEIRTISLNTMTAPNSPEAAALGAEIVLRRKGRVLDALSDNLTALRQRFNAQDRILLDKLNETNKNLSKLISAGLQGTSTEEFGEKVSKLETERENLEAEISRRSAGFYERQKPVTLEDVRKLIPENAVLLEFSLYRPTSPETSELLYQESPLSAELRYVVYLIRKEGKIEWKDLGEAQTLDAAITNWRKALRDPKNSDVKTLGRTLDKKIMKPIRQLTHGAKHLLISPDGVLNLIPFEALVDENEHFLIENHSITYLSGGRDLLRLQTERESKSKPLIFANPLFGETDPAVGFDVRKTDPVSYFAPLGGTAQEARLIQTQFPDAEVLIGMQATESALKQIAAPSILHIATHGFFLEDKETSGNTNPGIENPLLRSGLAFAGANQRKDGNDDGILTALEASGLNLWGTKLVVLSACDTGLGEVKNGEGVYGFRRAFVLAGTESIVMSLWSVSDYVTRELMTNYYKNLKQGMGRGESLRQVQLEMLKNSNRQHPFYWAGFIQSGEWANLEGKR